MINKLDVRTLLTDISNTAAKVSEIAKHVSARKLSESDAADARVLELRHAKQKIDEVLGTLNAAMNTHPRGDKFGPSGV
jgi:hypothetical protein